jgi:CheY-like chemotaxis protein
MLHLFKQKIQEKNLKLEVEYDKNIPEVLLGDPVRLHQIILNLISNAIKFTNDGFIRVFVEKVKETKNKVTLRFSVSDSGIGIEKAKLGKIFENFQQGSSDSSRLYGGTGLGLAIAKKLVVSQGGYIHVESEINKGSTFSFTLDFLKTDKKPDAEIEIIEQNGDLKRIKILVAEDVPLNQLLMKTILEEFGFECDIAENGKIAVEKMKVNVYDAILMDLQMPKMNGFEATEYIRKRLQMKIPIIALTADVTTVDLDKCTAVGMNEYIAKPIDERQLYNKIVKLVKQSVTPGEQTIEENHKEIKRKCTDLVYLMQRTKSNPTLMMEMIALYLEQTPPLIETMKQSLRNKDWDALYSAVHKMIPSFAIMGISHDFELMAKKVQEFATTQQQSGEIAELVLQLENVCKQACKELEIEYNAFKNIKNN